MISVCRNCRGAIEYTLEWTHVESGEQFCSLYFGLAIASPIIIEGVGTPTPHTRKD